MCLIYRQLIITFFQLLKRGVLFFVLNYFELNLFEFWIIGRTRRDIWRRNLWLPEPVMDIFHTFLMLYPPYSLFPIGPCVNYGHSPRHFTRTGVVHGASFIHEGLECNLTEWIHSYYCSVHLPNTFKAFSAVSPSFYRTSSTEQQKYRIDLFP